MRVYRLPQVCEATGRCRTAIYDAIKGGTFPKPIQLGSRAVGWLADEVDAWIISRPRKGALPAKEKGRTT